MNIFAPHNIDTMNEDDVAGELVRPLCRALGYTQGNPEANLRSQVSLQYDRAFLGHADGAKDPILRGRPDFVCEVVSYARWVVEAKKPSIKLSLQDSYQAHTYATHPEIAAEYYMLTNGREFQLFRVGKPDSPVLGWEKDATDDLLPALINFLGPDAMKKRASVKIDLGKPLAKGIGSSVTIVGGHVTYSKTRASIPLQADMDGLVNAVTGQDVRRDEHGLITALVDLKSAFAELEPLNKALGFYPLMFCTADEYISIDKERPTLLQNLAVVDMPEGTVLPTTPISPGGVLFFRAIAECYTEATGFIDGNRFMGTFSVDYIYDLSAAGQFIPAHLRNITMRTEGVFEINFVNEARQ